MPASNARCLNETVIASWLIRTGPSISAPGSGPCRRTAACRTCRAAAGSTRRATPPGTSTLFREADRCLVSGDASVTVRQESLYAVARQEREVNGPPAYFTPDWPAARRSVERLAALRPAIAATGHGVPMGGPVLTAGLEALLRNFDDVAVPDRGRHVPPGRRT